MVLVVKKNKANKYSSVRRTEENILMLLSNCTICGKKKSISDWIIEQIRDQKSIK